MSLRHWWRATVLRWRDANPKGRHMSRSRHLRRIVGVVVVATASLTWGAGAAFATDDPPIDQSNTVNVDQQGGGNCSVLRGGASVGGMRGGRGGRELRRQRSVRRTPGERHGAGRRERGRCRPREHRDAFAIGLLFAIAVGGDALAGASNTAARGNDLDLTNDLTTGNAAGVNAVEVSVASRPTRTAAMS